MRASEIGNFFRAFIDKQNDDVHLLVILRDGFSDMMEQRRFTRARRRDDQAALAHAKRRHQIHDPGRISFRQGLELDPFIGVDGRKFLERPQALIFGGLSSIDREQFRQLRTAIAAPRLAVNPHPVTQTEAPDNFRRDENVLWRLHEVTLRVPQKTKTLAGNFDDAFAELRFSRDLFACFNRILFSWSI